jgi:cysteine desulfurase
VSSHKISGPLGSGAAIVPPGLKIAPHVMGDTSYHRYRGGTENVPAAAGLGAAIEIMASKREEIWSHTLSLRERLIGGLADITDKLQNGPTDVPDEPLPLHKVDSPVGMPDLANITFNFIEGEAITLYLDMEDIAVSTGSACASWNLQANYVLVAMGRSHEEAHGSIRFSTDERNTADEIDRTIEVIGEVVERLRSMSAFKPKE